MLPENRAFFIRGDDGIEYGPVELDELREWVRENRAGLGSRVRLDESGSDWHPWQYYPELVALLAEARVSGAAEGPPGCVIAPIWRRILAWGLDMTFLSILLIPFGAMLEQIMPLREVLRAMSDPVALQTLSGPLLAQVVALEFIINGCLVLYLTAFHTTLGFTPAKALLRIRVVNEIGQKPRPISAFIRALLLILSVNLFFIPLAYAFLSPQRRTFHDLIARTYVVDNAPAEP